MDHRKQQEGSSQGSTLPIAGIVVFVYQRSCIQLCTARPTVPLLPIPLAIMRGLVA